MQAAVQAERAEAAVQEQEPTTWPPRHGTSAGPEGNDVTAPAAEKINGKRKHTARPGGDVQPERRAKPGRTAKPQPAEKATAKPQPAEKATAKPQPAEKATAKPQPAEKAERAVDPGVATRAEPAVRPEQAAKPAAIEDENEVTEWLNPAARPQPATGTGTAPTRRKQAAAPARTGRPASPSPGAAKKPGRRRPTARVAARMVIIVLVVGALAVAAVTHFARHPSSGPTSAAVARQQAAARNQAATWVARQVSRDAVVSCDPVMCAALRAHGIPSRDLLVLGSASPVPATAVVVETAVVQGLFGSSLATAWAPAVLASFGSGPAAITVRVIAKNGAAAYRTLLNADLADRKNAGAALLNDQKITVPGLAGAQLTGGQVDSRLLLALADLGGNMPITIVQFGNPGPGASADVPLRFVDLAENVPAAHLARAAYVKSVRAYLSTVATNHRPATMTTVVLPNGQRVLRVEFTAPSPLGTFSQQGSP